MNELIVKENVNIKDMIYEVRGKHVMLDSDVAMLFGYETKQLNRQVTRNSNRFPENYCFQLTEEEYKYLRCQNGTSSLESNYGGRRYLPYVFTEHGITMLAGLLKSDIAVEMSLKIVDTFIVMRKLISSNVLEQKHFNSLVLDLENRVNILEEYLPDFKIFDNQIFYDGQIYDAYSLLLDIFNDSKNNIVIIDNYISKELLDVLCKISVDVIIYTKNIDNTLLNKYNSQYNNITIKIDNRFHDRFIIIDNKILYHCGASFKDLGKKCFCISRIEDNKILSELLNRI